LALFEKQLASGGQPNRAGGAVEQAHLQAVFQRGDGPAHVGAREVQRVGRRNKRARRGNGHEFVNPIPAVHRLHRS
jgi:hypothetical protein